MDCSVGADEPRVKCARARGLMLALLTCLLIYGTYVAGLKRDMDRGLAAESYGRFQYAAAISISNQVYGLGGWATHLQTFSDLMLEGLTTDQNILKKLGSKYPENFSDPAFIDATVARVAAKPKPAPECPQPIAWDDLGFSDYVGLSFRLFGYHISGLYKLFFILVLLSSLVCVLAGRDLPSLRLIPPVFAMALYLTLRSGIFTDHIGGLYTVANPRFLSVLALVPALHLVLLLLHRRAPDRFQVTLAALQAGMIVFACHIRASSWWAPIAITGCWAAVTLARDARKLLRRSDECTDKRRLLIEQGWPAALLIAALLLFKVYVGLTLHPAYKTGGAVGAHAFWHSVVYSYQYHPDMLKVFPEWGKTKYTAGGDELPFAAATAYMNSLSEEDRHNAYGETGPDTPAKWEKVFRTVALHIVLTHPVFTMETFLVYKPKLLWSIIAWYFHGIEIGAFGVAFLFLALLAAAVALSGASRRIAGLSTVLAATLVAPFSFIPVLVTVPHYNVMADALVAFTTFCAAALLLVPLALLDRS